MQIILNADDFGFDQDTTDVTIDCFNKGALTSATIMAKMSATQSAIDYAKQHPEHSFGVHLTYGGDGIEEPVTDPSKIPALAGEDGKLLQSNLIRRNALCNKIPLDQIELETEAQISFLRDHGLNISHVDSHGHIHKFKPFRLALMNVLPRFNITRVRTVQNIYLRKPYKSPTFWFRSYWRQKLDKSFTTTQDFYMPTSGSDTDWPMQIFKKLGSTGTIEIGVHPGQADQWRLQETVEIQDFAPRVKDQGHQLVGWDAV